MLAVDWGTSRLRVCLLDENGKVQGEAQSDLGLTKAREVGFEKSLRDTAGKLLEGVSAVMMSGMVGAQEGWRETPYLDCPCSAKDILGAMAQVNMEGVRMKIAPGVKCMHGQLPDVMRGEETQVLGAVSQGAGDGVYVLPGTHSKWVVVEEGRITQFKTFMTGDVYRAVRNNTIFGMAVDEEEEIDKEQFVGGVREGTKAKSGGQLLSLMFSARTLRLFGKLENECVSSYLGGMMIGSEIAEGKGGFGATEIMLVGSKRLCESYSLACKEIGIKPQFIGEDTAVAGLCLYRKLLNGD